MTGVEQARAERWCYSASFEFLPELFALLAELGIEWKMIDAWPLGHSVSIETCCEIECAWRMVGKLELKRCWTEIHEGGPCLIVCSRVRVDDAAAFEALLGTRDPPP